MNKLLFITSLTTTLLSCSREEHYDPISKIDAKLESLLSERSGGLGKYYYVLPKSNEYSKIPQDPRNPITKAKVNLGKMLFHETGLGQKPKKEEGRGTYSCASCHHAKGGFQATLRQGIGDGGIGFGLTGESRTKSANYTNELVDVQPIKSPSALNGAYQKVTLWNGQFGATGMNANTQSQWIDGTPKETNKLGYEGLETQAIAGLKVHRLLVNKPLMDALGYTPFFDKAFPDIEESKRYSFEIAGLAIAAYERTILANEAPFQKWLRGDVNSMSEKEKKGAVLFFEKAKCYECHNGSALNSMSFMALGMKDLMGVGILGKPVDEATKKGRGGFTKNAEDDYKFKVPQLYSIVYNGFYGHGSSFSSVKEVIEYKNKAVKENIEVPDNKLDAKFKPLNLSEEEIDLLTLFIEKSLNDSDLDRYVPERVLSNNCIPNNDVKSQQEICN
ncbi:cytochrome-c peroxidase [Tenacibaculum maritimum]|uniref:cytochrome-c peroxidase n=1 Tax=Tenacibaculum maritimum TaxID=107401 RepID=UPI001E52651C|nr:cytochrome c peroxidase [Tenacibaculum maritimum]MCD9611571.1 cytochrome-c peroxidase [Tenacibaculum maritimum]